MVKIVNNQNIWNFKIGSQESMNDSLWNIIGFQQQDRQDSQNLSNDTFCSLPVTCAQCRSVTEKYPNVGILLEDDVVDCSQGYGKTKGASRALKNRLYPSNMYSRSRLYIFKCQCWWCCFFKSFQYPISRFFLQPPNQLKKGLNLMELFLLMKMFLL